MKRCNQSRRQRRREAGAMVVAGGLLLAVPVVAAAQQQQTGTGGVRPPAAATQQSVSLEVTNADIRDALTQLFKTAGVPFTISDNVRGRVTISLKNLPLETALRTLLRSAPQRLAYSKTANGAYQVRLASDTSGAASASGEAASASPASPAATRRIFMDVRDAAIEGVLSSAFTSVFGAEGRNRFTIEPAARNSRVTVSVQDKLLKDTLDAITGAATPSLSWSQNENGTYVFRLRGSSTNADTNAAPESEKKPIAPVSGTSSALVTVDARDAEVRSVLLDLFRQAGITNYSIANDVAGYVTLRLQDKTLEEALTLLMRVSNPPLSYRKSPEGVYEIRRRYDFQRSGGSSASERFPADVAMAAAAQSADSSSGQYDTINPVYAPVGDVKQVMDLTQPGGITRVIAYEPLNLIIIKYGDPAREGFQSAIISHTERGGGGMQGPGNGMPGLGGGGSPLGGSPLGGSPLGGSPLGGMPGGGVPGGGPGVGPGGPAGPGSGGGRPLMPPPPGGAPGGGNNGNGGPNR